ncbi:HrpE/YscL family type III secretion apparatus protein [Simkania negevensis]|uniref:Flagellar assembly protein FliH n=1 Tax=Simkania negevensis (strain ATCC VR-1471 / DSM 27360 / Z) TaxID=331113 RepID=F8L616_SIMNZ|nr:HrpE/YscL family type III secretion apparatus protein [Simkania negevensis]MCB1066599.1 HrpE/YscL family type III secretion apparatus protein [Simkania sp.]MCB1075094.1 HrpE/YscL family type III secretion apparatus protein [Simkania sp.]MCP5491301.1 HrpE/YscL family type III secretion apparatus protein [Chlamydiales bacterium]CCB88168.1 type III secretion ATPase inhibitor [Simkania negevensis Z]
MSKYFSLIFSGEVHRAEEDKILPEEEYSVLLDALEVLAKAKEDVKTYLKQNKEECEKVLKKAEEAGFNKGLTEFNKQILLYEQKMKVVEHDLQKMILPLALKAAKKIVGRELETRPDTIVDIVRQTLKPVTQNHHIKIYVNKKDREILEEKKQDLRKSLDQVQTFSIEEREDVSPGGCIIETEAGIINASLENQWRALEAAFEAFMKH